MRPAATEQGKVGCRRRERKTCYVPLTLCWFWQPKATKLDFNGAAWLLLGELLPDLPLCMVLSKPGVVHSWLVLTLSAYGIFLQKRAAVIDRPFIVLTETKSIVSKLERNRGIG